MTLVLAFVLVGGGTGQAYGAGPTMPDRHAAVQRGEAPMQQDLPPEVAQGTGPRGTSGETHSDDVGYAALMRDPPAAAWSSVAIGVAHPSLPPGTLVELTALDTGRTIVAMVVARADSAVVALSPGAAQALGVGDRAAVRVRTVVASPQDERALRSGAAASSRLDAPPTLLTALRRKLPDRQRDQRRSPRLTAPVRNAPVSPRSLPPRTRPAPVVAPRNGFVVQVAALSSPERATALAQQLGGRVARSGSLYRVQLGPFATTAEAQRARDGVARRGYGDARISHTD